MRGDQAIIDAATQLKREGVEITTVSFGRMTNRQALRAICSHVYNEVTKSIDYSMYEISNYDEPDQFADEIINGELCDEIGMLDIVMLI